MADKDAPKPRGRPKKVAAGAKRPLWRRLIRWVWLWCLGVAVFFVALILIYKLINPPATFYITQERWRLGSVDQSWVSMDDIAPVMGRSVVASEDANFCEHWGFDMVAIRQAIDAGGNRGASTLTQQVAKNVFLWHGRNYTRKAMEALLTPLITMFWSKRRTLEVYLNVAEFGEGIFGVEAAAQHYFGVPAAKLTAVQAARLAAVLPDPKDRNPAKPSRYVQRRARQVVSGAETIAADGRAACFE